MTTTLPVPPAPPPADERSRRPRRRSWIFVGLVVVLAWPSVSYTRALTYPGNASFSVRTVEWIRDEGGGWLVDQIEIWWYANPPTASAPDPSSLPPAGAPGNSAPVSAVPEPVRLRPGLAPLAGEGVWTAGTPDHDGVPAVFTTFFRPDPAHPSVVAAVAHFDRTRTRVMLIPGTREPVPARAAEAQVPADARAALVATFNSGFRIKDAHGGYFIQGRELVPLRDGAASLVVHTDGSATVGQWGRDARPGPDIAAVRQNLDLIVDNGAPVPGLDTNSHSAWGSAYIQSQYTWRSAAGIDAHGDLIYIAGPNLALRTLADALTQAGAVTGMQLDIHNPQVDMFTYRQAAGGPTATKLLPSMPGPIDRYLTPDQRDFVAVALR